MKWYWMSTGPMTVAVEVDEEGTIRRTPAIVRKFRGRDVDDLRRWLQGLDGEFREATLMEMGDG